MKNISVINFFFVHISKNNKGNYFTFVLKVFGKVFEIIFVVVVVIIVVFKGVFEDDVESPIGGKLLKAGVYR
jgi:hypothetical protein